MKKILSTLLLAASLTSAQAQEVKIVSGKVRCSDHSEVVLPEGMSFRMKDLGNKRPLAPIRPLKASPQGETGTVTVKVVSVNKPVDAYIINKDVFGNVEFSGMEGSLEVPQGTYDVFVEFEHAYVFKEDVQVTGDLTLEFDENEAIYPVELRYFDENGQQLHLDITYKGKVDTKGTADDMIKLTSIAHKDYGYAAFYMDFCGRRKGELEDFYINKVSDKYYVAQSATVNVGSHYYTFKGVAKDLTQRFHDSDSKNILKLVTDFTLSPQMPDHKYVGLPGIESAFLLDGFSLADTRMWGMGSDEDNGKVITFIDCPEALEGDPYPLNVAARPIITDSYTFTEDPDYGDMEEFTFIMTPLAIGDANTGVKYHVAGSDLNNMFNIPVGDTRFKFYPGHPDFSFRSPDGTGHFGTSVPILSYRSVQLVSNGQVYPIDQFRYLGRLGELRETDEKFADVKEEETTDGTLVTITNNNVVVDGIDGKNVTEVLYNLKKEDACAPTFQMMTFKDKDGNISDRFSTVDGAKMLVTGGDFTYQDNRNPPYIGHFTCAAPESVKAYYAPYGTDNWTELNLVEDPAKYFMPVFAYFYSADLSNVKAEEDDTWFDIRLEMTDSVGNYQKQTISPAFLIKNANSIDRVDAVESSALVVAGKTVKVAGGETAQIMVRTIDGRTVRQAYADTLDLSDLGAGLYIVTATMADGRVVSTKVTM